MRTRLVQYKLNLPDLIPTISTIFSNPKQPSFFDSLILIYFRDQYGRYLLCLWQKYESKDPKASLRQHLYRAKDQPHLEYVEAQREAREELRRSAKGRQAARVWRYREKTERSAREIGGLQDTRGNDRAKISSKRATERHRILLKLKDVQPPAPPTIAEPRPPRQTKLQENPYFLLEQKVRIKLDSPSKEAYKRHFTLISPDLIITDVCYLFHTIP